MMFYNFIVLVNPQNESKRLQLDRLKSFMGGKVPAKIEVKGSLFVYLSLLVISTVFIFSSICIQQ